MVQVRHARRGCGHSRRAGGGAAPDRVGGKRCAGRSAAGVSENSGGHPAASVRGDGAAHVQHAAGADCAVRQAGLWEQRDQSRAQCDQSDQNLRLAARLVHAVHGGVHLAALVRLSVTEGAGTACRSMAQFGDETGCRSAARRVPERAVRHAGGDAVSCRLPARFCGLPDAVHRTVRMACRGGGDTCRSRHSDHRADTAAGRRWPNPVRRRKMRESSSA